MNTLRQCTNWHPRAEGKRTLLTTRLSRMPYGNLAEDTGQAFDQALYDFQMAAAVIYQYSHVLDNR